ncbi:uncharacterized protein LOC111993424 [Quercus suber]|uniref:uncharacterized protein LOC111993424 n=1 Tax=Quercus suber TaxID=58331 RepID=UPI0032E001D9
MWSDQGIWGFRCEVDFISVKELLLWMVEEVRPGAFSFPAWSIEGSNGCGGNRWRASLIGFVKANFDGANSNVSRLSGVGVLIRDPDGAVLASCAEKFDQAYKAEDTEALAKLKALTFAHDLCFQNVVLEGDALSLIQVLKSHEQNLSLWGLLIEYVKVYRIKFRRLLYSHVKRNGNSVAHNLAKHAICIPDFQVWMEDVPSHIVPFLHLDTRNIRRCTFKILTHTLSLSSNTLSLSNTLLVTLSQSLKHSHSNDPLTHTLKIQFSSNTLTQTLKSLILNPSACKKITLTLKCSSLSSQSASDDPLIHTLKIPFVPTNGSSDFFKFEGKKPSIHLQKTLIRGIGNLSAVFLFPILMFYFKLGATGAAISTVLSQYIVTFLLIWHLNKRAVLLPPKLGSLQFGGYLKSGGFFLGRTLCSYYHDMGDINGCLSRSSCYGCTSDMYSSMVGCIPPYGCTGCSWSGPDCKFFL